MRVHRGLLGLGQNTLAPGGLTEADCEANGMVIDTVTGFCVLDNYATPAELQLAAQSSGVNASQYAPPVYLSTYTAQPNTGSQGQSYYTDQTAAEIAGQVNVYNNNLYNQYQIAVQNWVMNGSVGNPPSPPVYETFDAVWATENLGGTPASISTAPPGTPLPAGTYLTGGNLSIPNNPGPYIPSPVVIPTPSNTVTQQQIQNASQSPPVQMPSGSSTNTGSSSNTGTFDLSAFLQESSVGGIPNWMLGGGILAFLFIWGNR